MELIMDISVVKAYANGRIAGSKYSQARQLDRNVPRPTNPSPPDGYLASIEWERGFAEGFERSERFASPSISADGGGTQRRSA
jgi:hypothetical protein